MGTEDDRHSPLTRLDPPPQPGGDPACWLASVCECGAFIEGAPGTACWHCGRTTGAD